MRLMPKLATLAQEPEAGKSSPASGKEVPGVEGKLLEILRKPLPMAPTLVQ